MSNLVAAPTEEQIAVAKTILRQIGTGNVLAISGGRWQVIENGVRLPCGAGYRVDVVLDRGLDLYEVSRVFRKAGVEYPHGIRRHIDFTQVGETAYRASCFRSYDAQEW
jgi:hypothetical protein